MWYKNITKKKEEKLAKKIKYKSIIKNIENKKF